MVGACGTESSNGGESFGRLAFDARWPIGHALLKESYRMATIRFRGFGEINVPKGTSILEAARDVGAPEGSECGGCCSCSTCHVYVHAGAELLSTREDDELDILDNASDVRDNSRLGCQAQVKGEGIIEVEISKESMETYFDAYPGERAKLAAR
jgi:2Fe-2S ferredoxin